MDWYVEWRRLRVILAAHHALPDVKDAPEIFVPGVGCSSLPEHAIADGFVNLTCADVSSIAVSFMKQRLVINPSSDCVVLDVTSKAFAEGSGDTPPSESFDLIIDKALLDCLLCGEDVGRRCGAALRGYSRCLRRGGTLAVVSHGAPADRLALLRQAQVDGAPLFSLVESVAEVTGSDGRVAVVYLARK
jgi:hypothetical protein